MSNINFDWDKIFGIRKEAPKRPSEVIREKESEVFEKKAEEEAKEEPIPCQEIREPAFGLVEPLDLGDISFLHEEKPKKKKKKSTEEKVHKTDRDATAVRVCDLLDVIHFNMRRAFLYMERELLHGMPPSRSFKLKKYLTLCLIAKSENGKIHKNAFREIVQSVADKKLTDEYEASFLGTIPILLKEDDWYVFRQEHEAHITKVQEFIKNGLRSKRGRRKKDGLES